MARSSSAWFSDSKQLWLYFDTAPDDSSLLGQAVTSACARYRFLPVIAVPEDWIALTNRININRVDSFQDALFKRLATVLRSDCRQIGGSIKAVPDRERVKPRDPVTEGYLVSTRDQKLRYERDNPSSNWRISFPDHDTATLKKHLTSLFCNVATVTYEQTLSAQMATTLDGFFRVRNCETIDYPPSYPSSGPLENDEVLATRLVLNELNESLWPSVLVSIALRGDNRSGRERLARHFEWPLTLLALLQCDNDVASSYAPFASPPRCHLQDWCYLYGIVQNEKGALLYAHYMVWNEEAACWNFASTLITDQAEWAATQGVDLGVPASYASILATVHLHALRIQERIRDLLDREKNGLLLKRLNDLGQP